MTINEQQTGANMNWNHPHASRYPETIAAKIPGYANLYEMGVKLLGAALDPTHQGKGHDAHLLIAGAGGGQELEAFGVEEPQWTFTGVDPSPVMLERARRRIEESGIAARTRLVLGELKDGRQERSEHAGEDLPLLDAREYDAAACMLVLHFVRGIEAKKQHLQAIADRLKPGAPFLIASLNADFDSPVYPIVMEAWRAHMLSQGITEEDWLRFATSLGPQSDPIPSSVVEQLLEECGFCHAERYFGAFLIDGWLAFKKEEGEA
ncbi:class I SAM-dependent methyltransferase [Saccharibacillus sacchari]|uniref:class I SAM-dependent methyltransferase n=1 Tax=Saccharibacillus sacchari TaxID=456493 RepID=UPI0004B03EF5|nr:class I SAM-dependent methyltransferase [Saccharibacillus sacchari]